MRVTQYPDKIDDFGLAETRASRNALVADSSGLTVTDLAYAVIEIEHRLGTGALIPAYGGTGVTSIAELETLLIPSSNDDRAFLRRSSGGALEFAIPKVLDSGASTIGSLSVGTDLSVGGTLGVTGTSLFGDKITTEHVQIQDGYYFAMGETTPLGWGTGSFCYFELYGGATLAKAQMRLRTESDSASLGGGILLYHNRASLGMPSSGDRLGYILMGARDASDVDRNAVGILGYADQTWTSGSAIGARIEFQVAANGTTSRTTRMVIKNDGSVGIGRTPTARLFEVEGAGYFKLGSGGELLLDSGTASAQINVTFQDNGSSKFAWYKTTGNLFRLYDYANGLDIVEFNADSDASVDWTGHFAVYDSIATEGKGVPPIHEYRQWTDQGADISYTAASNTAVEGFYRISVYVECDGIDPATETVDVTVRWRRDSAGGGGWATKSTGTVNLSSVGNHAEFVIAVHHEADSGNSIEIQANHSGGSDLDTYELTWSVERISR